MRRAIVDIDGIVVDSEERFQKVQGIYAGNSRAFWAAFFSSDFINMDTPIEGAKAALDALVADGFEIVYLTSRPESMKSDTEWQLRAFKMPNPQNVVHKPKAEQYTKTTQWKAGEAVRLAAPVLEIKQHGDVLLIDDTDENVSAMLQAIVERYGHDYDGHHVVTYRRLTWNNGQYAATHVS